MRDNFGKSIRGVVAFRSSLILVRLQIRLLPFSHTDGQSSPGIPTLQHNTSACAVNHSSASGVLITLAVDMDIGSSNSTMAAMMKPYIHFTPGDILYFSNWSPKSTGAMVGACLALFMMAFFERLVVALGRMLDVSDRFEYPTYSRVWRAKIT